MSVSYTSFNDNGDWLIENCANEERDNIIIITKKILEEHANPYLENWENLTFFEIATKINIALKWKILKSVMSLNLSGQKLTYFPERVIHWIPNVETLDLSNNNLRELPKKLSSLSHLRTINFANNPHLQLEPKFFEEFQDCSFEVPFTIFISEDQQRMAETFTDLPTYCQIYLI